MRLPHVLVLAPVLTVAQPGLLRAQSAEESASETPPPTSVEYFEYGVALVAEAVADPADVCQASATPCILGSGGGLALRAGYRTRGPWYFGGVYELGRHDSSNLIRLAILQQLRGELRHYWEFGARTSPYLGLGVGGMLYGNEWGAETGGIVASLGIGFLFQLSEAVLVGAEVAYRPMAVRAWTDSAGEARAQSVTGFGLAHLAALELALEVRNPLPRW